MATSDATTSPSLEQGHPNEAAIELRAQIDVRLRDLQNTFSDPPSEHQAISYASA
jgi:hypothetical protein